MQLDKNHITFQAEESIRKILAPLTKASAIQYFSYGVNYPDKSGFTLLTHSEYYQQAMNQELPLAGFYLKEGWHLWNTSLSQNHLALAENYQLGNGILLVKSHPDQTEIIEFAGALDNTQLYDFYMNNVLLLKKFIAHFCKQAADIIDQAKMERIFPSSKMILKKKIAKSMKLDQEAISNILIEIDYPIDLLSKRELQCFHYLIRGYSIAQISEETTLAVPTIANYISRIKHKTRCFSRKDMTEKAHALGLIEYC